MPISNSLQATLRAQLEALPGRWGEIGRTFLASTEGRRLLTFIGEREGAGATIYPPQPLRALLLTPFASVRVVVLGQDPYHGAGQAHGLAFSVPEGAPLPPSLRNLFVELQSDLGVAPRTSGSLERWALQGVLLLNSVMTVEESRPASHAGKGWEAFTDSIVDALAHDAAPKVFLLWGAYAQAKAPRITAAAGHHAVLCSNHPSPLSARRGPTPFFGCRHFSLANDFLARRGRGTIDWG